MFFALSDAIAKLNVIPCHLNWDTPYIKWFGYVHDFLRSPLLPFECGVMAHNAVYVQTKMSDNATLYYYVCPAVCHTHYGVLLYNSKRKQTIVRRSFQKLEDNDRSLSILPLEMTYDKTSVNDLIPSTSLPCDIINAPVSMC